MKAQQRLLALEASSADDQLAFNDEDLFQLQHHHLLSCLERTTVCSVSAYVCLSVCLSVCVALFLSVCHGEFYHFLQSVKVSGLNLFLRYKWTLPFRYFLYIVHVVSLVCF